MMDVKKGKKRSKSQKKTRETKKAMYTNVAKVPRTILQSPFYGTQKVTHKYVEFNNQLNPGIAYAPGYVVFSANGMYDPYVAVGGHQPMGYDQMAAMYHKYTVINSQIRVTFSNQTSTNNRYIIGVCVTRANTLLDRYQYTEGHCSWDVLGSGSVDGSPKTLYLSTSPGAFYSKKNILSEDDLAGTATSQPASEYYFHVFAMDEGTADPPAITATVEIAYTAVWHEPKQLSSS